MKKIIIIIILLTSYFFSFSQTNNVKYLKNWQLIGYAESAERINDKYTAIDYYSEYYNRKKDNDKISYKLANLYFESKDFKNAKPIYYSLYENKKYSRALYRYAQILKSQQYYDSALSCFEIYRDQLITNEKKSLRNLYFFMIAKEIEGCELAVLNSIRNNDIKVTALNSSINKAHKESAPIIMNDTVLIYSSFNMDSLPTINIGQTSNLPVDKFYAAKYINNRWQGGFTPPKPFFNFDSLYTSGGVFSNDKKRFYFTISNKNKLGENISSIYVSKYKNGEWENPEKLNNQINYKNYINAQPTIGKCYNNDFDVIYFVSNRPGGAGGTDIWYFVYDILNNQYKKAYNAGSYINTPENEVTPHYNNSTKTMYYSSNGLSSYGGYDIYKTTGELINWIPSINLGYPINSPYDDIYYTKSKKDTMGFLVSNRSEGKILKTPHCCFDIFQYNVIKDDDIIIAGTIYEYDENYFDNLLKSDSTNSKTKENKTSSNSIVELYIKNTNNDEYIFIKADTTQNNGNFKFKVDENQDYLLSVTKNNHINSKIKFNTLNTKERLVVIEPISIIPIQKEAFSLSNIYFEFNKWELTEDSKLYIDTTLVTLLNNHKNIVIEIVAHTDGIGDSDYNLVLSKNRAENVVSYLKTKGISINRILARGYGESKPLANEFTANGEDKPEGRAKNRRIEFKIVGLLITE